MATPEEPDFPPGHPKRFDFDPQSPEAREWRRKHGPGVRERDWPVDHPAAVDTPGNKNAVQIVAGVDPNHPELEAFTGRTPAQAAAARAEDARLAALAVDSPVREPGEAPPPPATPGDTRPPSGQPA